MSVSPCSTLTSTSSLFGHSAHHAHRSGNRRKGAAKGSSSFPRASNDGAAPMHARVSAGSSSTTAPRLSPPPISQPPLSAEGMPSSTTSSPKWGRVEEWSLGGGATRSARKEQQRSKKEAFSRPCTTPQNNDLVRRHVEVMSRTSTPRGSCSARASPAASLPEAPLFARGFVGKMSCAKKTSTRRAGMRTTLPITGSSSEVIDLFALRAATNKKPSSDNACVAGAAPSPLTTTLATTEPPATRVLDFLFLGNLRDAQNADFLRQHNIRCILNISTERYNSALPDVQVRTFPIEDHSDANIAGLFAPTRECLDRARISYFRALERHTTPPRVLIHCQKGRSRSATIVLAYLVYRSGLSAAEALLYVSQKRPSVEPNLGFLDALRNFQEAMDVETRTRNRSQQSLVLIGLAASTTKAQLAAFYERHVGVVVEVVMRGGARGASMKNSEDGSPPMMVGDVLAEEATPPASAVVDAEVHPSRGAALCIVMFACAENVRRAWSYANDHRDEMQRELGEHESGKVRLLLPSRLKRVSKPKTADELPVHEGRTPDLSDRATEELISPTPSTHAS